MERDGTERDRTEWKWNPTEQSINGTGNKTERCRPTERNVITERNAVLRNVASERDTVTLLSIINLNERS